VQIPTTLLAQVDSSIGGKTGVNLPIGKNLVGTFYQPRMVLADPAVLRTLPERELRAGLFEAIKCAVIGDPDLFEFMQVARRSILGGNPAALQHIIQACASLKGRVVSRDEREGDLRRILNFGHTLGHAIEAATDYRRFLHGEAIAWGMLAATRLAALQKILSQSEAERIAALIVAYGPVPALGKISPAEMAVHLGADKKVKNGKVHFVLPRHIGEVVITDAVHTQQAIEVMDELMRNDPFRSRKGAAQPPGTKSARSSSAKASSSNTAPKRRGTVEP
jgi:3-dehydroquinate synthase